jgi:hypothetical protein
MTRHSRSRVCCPQPRTVSMCPFCTTQDSVHYSMQEWHPVRCIQQRYSGVAVRAPEIRIETERGRNSRRDGVLFFYATLLRHQGKPAETRSPPVTPSSPGHAHSKCSIVPLLATGSPSVSSCLKDLSEEPSSCRGRVTSSGKRSLLHCKPIL